MKKYLFLFVAALLLGTTVKAQTPEQTRMNERNARHERAMQATNEAVMSQNYRFIPTSIQAGVAGRMRNIVANNYVLEVSKDGYVDIYMPYLSGQIPPLRQTLINYMTRDVQNYKAVQHDEGWTITFGVRLFDGNLYHFTLTTYSVTGETTLEVKSDANITVDYTGLFSGIQ